MATTLRLVAGPVACPECGAEVYWTGQDWRTVTPCGFSIHAHAHYEKRCRHCGKPIYRGAAPGAPGDAWLHESPDGWSVRSCRAASYVPGTGWDHEFPPHWKALPDRSSAQTQEDPATS